MKLKFKGTLMATDLTAAFWAKIIVILCTFGHIHEIQVLNRWEFDLISSDPRSRNESSSLEVSLKYILC